MFCKWCGKSIQLTDKKCPACGRETPPLSDCGGFYNLKHSNIGTTTEKIIIKEIPHCGAVEKMDVKYAKERKATKKHHAITMFCLIVVLLATVCSVLLALRVNNQMVVLKKQIDNIQIEIPTYPPETNIDKPEEEQESDPPKELTPYSFTIDTTVINGDPNEINNTYDFGDYTKSVKVTIATTTSENGQTFTVSYLLDEETSVELNLKYIREGTEALIISTKCNTDMSFFTNQDFLYEWQCRAENGSWLTVDPTLVTENDGYYSLHCNENIWRNVGEEEAMRDIRCVIKIKDIKGNMMTITVDGYTFAKNDSIG